MKAILEFYYPDDDKAHLRAVKSFDMALALWDITQIIRRINKYEGSITGEKLTDEFHDIMDLYDINLENLME